MAPGSPTAYIIKVDKNGTFLWDRRFKDDGDADDATFGDVRVTSNGYVFAGFNSPGNRSDNDPFYGLLSAPVDAPAATGTVTITRYYQDSENQGTYSILPLAPPTTGYFSVGNWRTTSSDMHLFALSMDSNLVAQTVHFYAHHDPSREVRSVTCKSAIDNKAPAIISPISEFDSGSTNDAGLILMRENGEKIWARQYGTTRSDISLDACQGLDRNSFYAVGSTMNTNGYTDLLVIKTDWEGKLNGGDQGCRYLEDALKEIFPSPQPGTVTLKIDKAYVENDATDPEVRRFAPIAASPCPHCTPPPLGMVGWWPLNEQAGATVVTDIQGGHNGTPLPSGSITAMNASRPGMVSGALFVIVTDRVSVADAPPLKFGTRSFSVDTWFASGHPRLIGGIVDKLDMVTKKGYAFYIENDHLKFVMGNGTSFTTYTGTAPLGLVTTGLTWHHVAVTVDRVNERGRFYIDGVGGPAFPTLSSSIDISTASTLLIGGSRQTFPPDSFGVATCVCEYVLDELEIFNGVLTAKEIKAIFKAGTAGKCRRKNR